MGWRLLAHRANKSMLRLLHMQTVVLCALQQLEA